MFRCDVAIQRIEVFEQFAALRAFNPIFGLAVARLLVHPELVWSFTFLLATLHLTPVPLPFLCMVNLVLPQGRFARVGRPTLRTLVLFG